MSWIGLIQSIPQMSKKACSLRREPLLPNLTVKKTYKTLVRPLVQQPTAQKSIECVLQRNDMDCATVYLLPEKTTIESRMRIFQYKILNSIMYLNNRPHKFGYAESPLCSRCDSETETMTRLFATETKLSKCGTHYPIGVRNVSLRQRRSQVQQFLVFVILGMRKANSLTISSSYLNILFM